jgi:hypothetical protein
MVQVKLFFRLGLILIATSMLVSCAYWPKFLTVPERQEFQRLIMFVHKIPLNR